MVYEKIYPDLFSKEEIPEQISDHFVYPEYLYNIQAKVLERYHNVQARCIIQGAVTYGTVQHIHAGSKHYELQKELTYRPILYNGKNSRQYKHHRLGLVLPFTH
ncbi:MAG: UPF0182 family protein [Clostridia bacterium]